jgi:hypothetical protein
MVDILVSSCVSGAPARRKRRGNPYNYERRQNQMRANASAEPAATGCATTGQVTHAALSLDEEDALGPSGNIRTDTNADIND